MNTPAIPPANANGLAFDNLREPHSLADNARSKACAQSSILDRNFEFVEQNKADQQNNRNNYWRRVMSYKSAASNQKNREKGPNDYMADLRVLVTRHRSLSGTGGGLAAC